jgi:acyl carrier protein
MEIENNQSLSKELQDLLAGAIQVPVDMVTPDLSFGDLPEWDSLGHMEILMRLEEQYGVEVNADTIAQLISVPEIIKYIEGHRDGDG